MNRFDRNSLEDSIANSLTNAINIMGFNPEAVAERLKFQHRSLQEDFTRICVEWLKIVADPEYPRDERNELAHRNAYNLLHPKKWAVITFYSFEASTTTKYFDTEKEAQEYLVEDFNNECDIAENENEDEILEHEVNAYAGYATLRTASVEDEHGDVMEWRIVEITI